MRRRGWFWAMCVCVAACWARAAEPAVEVKPATPAPVRETRPARERQRHVGVTLKADTRGLGGDLTVNLTRVLNARVGLQKGEMDVNVELDEANVDGTFDWQTVPILLDIHPGGGSFRFSGGVVLNDNQVLMRADPKEPLKLEGTEYEITSMKGSIRFDRTSYYIGLGAGNAVGRDRRVHMMFDFGFMYHGKPKVKARAESNLPPAAQERLDRDLQTEVDEFEEDISDYRWYPVLAFGLSVGF